MEALSIYFIIKRIIETKDSIPLINIQFLWTRFSAPGPIILSIIRIKQNPITLATDAAAKFPVIINPTATASPIPTMEYNLLYLLSMTNNNIGY